MQTLHLKEESGERLHLTVEPTLVTWAVAFGALSFIIGYPLCCYDCVATILLVWVLGTGALLAFFNPWLEVVLDKENHSLVISRQNAYQCLNLKAPTPVKYELDNVTMVRYESPSIILTFADGQTVDLNLRGDTQQLILFVDKIQQFLQLEVKEAEVGTPVSEVGSLHSEATNEDSSSATSDDSFERIDTADLADYESSKGDPENDIPSDNIETLSPSSEEPKELTSESDEASPSAESSPVPGNEEKLESAGDTATAPDATASPNL